MSEEKVYTEEYSTENESYYNLVDENEQDGEEDISTPFDPKKVDISVEQMTVGQLAARIEHEEIDLFPDFQRNGNLWDGARMSQLIESILIKLPLPAMYFDVADDDKWIVVDGLQRLSTIQRFVVDKRLKLKKMEFLNKLNDCSFDDLERVFQRRILETNITVFKIKKGTPKKVLTSLFHRINTGGLKLTPQEIRHALNQGKGTEFLKRISKQDWYKSVIKVSPKRMLNEELIVRFIAFYRRGLENYQPSLRQFLDDEMEYLTDKCSDEEMILFENALKRGLKLSVDIFGNYAFSKVIINGKEKTVLNRSLFEVTTVCFAKLDNDEADMIRLKKEQFLEDYKQLLKDKVFDNSITVSTSLKNNVEHRHDKLRALIDKYTLL